MCCCNPSARRAHAATAHPATGVHDDRLPAMANQMPEPPPFTPASDPGSQETTSACCGTA